MYLIEFLERNGDRSLTDLIQVVEKAWSKPVLKRKPPARNPFDPGEWVAKLERNRNDRLLFQQVLQELARSRQIMAPDVAVIANRFRSTTKKYKSKAAAIEDIRKAWMEGQRDTEKARNTGSIF